MLIAVPVIEKDINSVVCSSLSGTAYALVFDLDTKDIAFVDNTKSNSKEREANIVKKLIDLNIDCIIIEYCSYEIQVKLEDEGIRVYKSSFEHAIDNLNAFIAEKLEIFNNLNTKNLN